LTLDHLLRYMSTKRELPVAQADEKTAKIVARNINRIYQIRSKFDDKPTAFQVIKQLDLTVNKGEFRIKV